MAYKIERTIYFSKTGVENTDTALKAAKERAEKLGIQNIVVASTTGRTGVKASELFQGYNLVVVTHHTGFKEKDNQELSPANREKIMKNGGKILTTTHAFGGVGRAVRRKFNTVQLDELIAHTLRVFGQGIKVVCEIAIMAADAGLISVGEDVISIGGTGRGADTAIVVRPVNVQDFFDLKIKEIICKPF